MAAEGLEGEGKDAHSDRVHGSVGHFEQEKAWSDPVGTWTTGHTTHTHIYINDYMKLVIV